MSSRVPTRHIVRVVLLAIGVCASVVALTGCGGGQAPGMKAVWTIKGESPDALALYWTQRRMVSARPYALSATNAARGGAKTTGLPYTDRAWGWRNPTTPEGGRVVGKVFFEERGVAYYCTGAAVFSENRSVVLTAGHCAADGGSCPEAANCRPHQNWIFVPSFRNDASCEEAVGAGCPYGRYAAKELFAPDEWLRDGNHRYDFAAVVVEASDGLLLTDNTGDVLPFFDASPKMLVHRGYALFGYPKAAPFNGRLWACITQRARRDESRYEWFRGSTRTGSEPGPAELTAGCNMTAGSDGGPWLTPGVNGRTAIIGVSSFSPTGDRISGTYFGGVAKRIFELADATKVEGGEG